MLLKMMKICKWVHTLEKFPNITVTIGEVARWSKKPKSTVKRQLKKAVELGLIQSEFMDYKTTGREVFTLTKEGIDFVVGNEGMGL